ncbi:MAG: T9SS type A sorting domain-containing protein, partial [Bacteroidota bacterium]
GNYYVIVTDVNGCSSTSNIVYVDITGISENAALSVAIVPNPNNGTFELIIPGKSDKPVTFAIYDAIGQVVMNKDFHLPVKEVISLNLRSGVYFAHVNTPDGIRVFKVIIH